MMCHYLLPNTYFVCFSLLFVCSFSWLLLFYLVHTYIHKHSIHIKAIVVVAVADAVQLFNKSRLLGLGRNNKLLKIEYWKKKNRIMDGENKEKNGSELNTRIWSLVV